MISAEKLKKLRTIACNGVSKILDSFNEKYGAGTSKESRDILLGIPKVVPASYFGNDWLIKIGNDDFFVTEKTTENELKEAFDSVKNFDYSKLESLLSKRAYFDKVEYSKDSVI